MNRDDTLDSDEGPGTPGLRSRGPGSDGWPRARALARLAVTILVAAVLATPLIAGSAVYLVGCDGKDKNAAGNGKSPQAPQSIPGSALERAKRDKCSSNLRQLSNAIAQIVAGEVRYVEWPHTDPGKRYDGSDLASGAETLDTMGSMWLMVEEAGVSPDLFKCPSDQGAAAINDDLYDETIFRPDNPFPEVDATGRVKAGGGRRSWSYSYQVPQDTFGAPGAARRSTTRFAVLADRAPAADVLLVNSNAADDTGNELIAWLKGLSGDDKQRVNSPNHGGQGQNVMYQDDHVEFFEHPWCGIRSDNIYTRATNEGKSDTDRMKGTAPKMRREAMVKGTGPATDSDSFLANIRYGTAIPDGGF